MKRWTGILLLLALTGPLAAAQSPAKPMDDDDCATMKKSAADMDKKLQALLDDMNKAQGQAKIDKMAAVINELVAQRSAMQSHMMSMDEENCPMMKKDAAKMKTSSSKMMECH